MVLEGYLSDNVKITKLKDHTTAGTSDVTSDELDMAGYDGVLFLTSFGTAASNNKITMHQSASPSGEAASVGLISSGSSDEDTVLDVQHPAYRYVTLVATRGTSSTLESIWAIQYRARAVPPTNAVSGTMAVGQFNAPALA